MKGIVVHVIGAKEECGERFGATGDEMMCGDGSGCECDGMEASVRCPRSRAEKTVLAKMPFWESRATCGEPQRLVARLRLSLPPPPWLWLDPRYVPTPPYLVDLNAYLPFLALPSQNCRLAQTGSYLSRT